MIRLLLGTPILLLLAHCSGPGENTAVEDGNERRKRVRSEVVDNVAEASLMAEGKLNKKTHSLFIRVRPKGIGTFLLQIAGAPKGARIYLKRTNGELKAISFFSADGDVVPWHEFGNGMIGASSHAEATAKLVPEESKVLFSDASLWLSITTLRPNDRGLYESNEELIPISLVEVTD